MGDYTAVRFKAELNEWGTRQITTLLTDGSWHNTELPREWLEQSRCRTIPFGGVCYAPADWLEKDVEEWDQHRNSLEGATWDVFCSTKDGGAIAAFLSKCLPKLIKTQAKVETFFELDYEQKTYFVNPE